jgi:hypothetical protein
MHERARAIGGVLEIETTPGTGTVIKVAGEREPIRDRVSALLPGWAVTLLRRRIPILKSKSEIHAKT